MKDRYRLYIQCYCYLVDECQLVTSVVRYLKSERR